MQKRGQVGNCQQFLDMSSATRHTRHHESTFEYLPNSDGLGLLTLQADGRRRVHGGRPGRSASRCPGGTLVVCWWCLGGFLVLFRSCLGGVSVVSWWFLGDFSVVSWCFLGGVPVVSW